MFCVLSIWKLFTTSLDLQDLKWSYEQGNKLVVTGPEAHVVVAMLWKSHLVLACPRTSAYLFRLHRRENFIFTCAEGGLWWLNGHGWKALHRIRAGKWRGTGTSRIRESWGTTCFPKLHTWARFWRCQQPVALQHLPNIQDVAYYHGTDWFTFLTEIRSGI